MRADKGHGSLREEYLNKIELMLQDQNTYITVNKNSIVNLEKNLNVKKVVSKRIRSKTYLSYFRVTLFYRRHMIFQRFTKQTIRTKS